ncbi:MAG: BrnT family toxin [Burkholderiales bacterium]
MKSRFTWNEIKRAKNLEKHHLDFADADWVLGSPLRLDIDSVRNNEVRTQSFAYVFDRLAVLTIVHLQKDRPHIISFRTASEEERKDYHDWLKNDYTA